MDRSRRGSYAALFGVSILVFLGFAALAVDAALVRLGDTEVQAIADASAQAALLRLRASGDRAHATWAAEQVAVRNHVTGSPAALAEIEFGIYDGASFSVHPTRANAVRVQISADVPLVFSTLWGQSSVPLTVSAAAATRSLHAVVVVDITNSWNQSNFEDARAGAVAVFDQIAATRGPDDKIGMVVFTGQFGIEQTPLTTVDHAVVTGVRDEWAALRTASKAGWPEPGTSDGCGVYGGESADDFSNPAGGCFPHMWREYLDEYGTDHAVGIEMALTMFAEQNDPSVYRALILLTDGEPNGTGPHQSRIDDGFVEDRWRYTFVGDQRGTAEVINQSVGWSNTAWANHEVHVWAVSYIAWAAWLEDVAQGDGSFIRATDSGDLVPIFEDIAESLPLTLFE